MKKLFLALLFAGAVCAAQAQVVQSSRMTVERKPTTGYRGFVELGFTNSSDVGKRNEEFPPNNYSDENYMDLNLFTTHGYQFPSGIFLGGGTGLETFASLDAFTIPIYANFRYYFRSRSIFRAYTDLRFGHNISVGDYVSIDERERLSLNGWFASVGFGLEIGRFSVSVNYMPMRYKLSQTIFYRYGSTWEDYVYRTSIAEFNKIAHSLNVRLGFSF